MSRGHRAGCAGDGREVDKQVGEPHWDGEVEPLELPIPPSVFLTNRYVKSGCAEFESDADEMGLDACAAIFLGCEQGYKVLHVGARERHPGIPQRATGGKNDIARINWRLPIGCLHTISGDFKRMNTILKLPKQPTSPLHLDICSREMIFQVPNRCDAKVFSFIPSLKQSLGYLDEEKQSNAIHRVDAISHHVFPKLI